MCAYAPGVAAIPLGGVTPMGAQYYAQGAQSFQNSLESGLNRWFENDKQDTQTRAQVAAMLPQLADKLTNPEDKTLVEKFMNHKTNYKDNGYLLGLLTTHQAQDQMAMQKQMQQSQILQMQLQTEAAQRAAEQQKQAQANVNLGSLAQRNPNILNNAAYAKGNAIASDPLFGIAKAAQQFNLSPDVVERFASNRYVNGMSLPPQTVDYIDPKTGLPSKVQIDPRTRQPVNVNIGGQTVQSGSPQIPAGVLLPDQSADAEYKKAMATSAAKRYDTVQGAVNGYQNTIDTIDQTIPLIQSGEVKTGPLQESFNTVKKGLNDALNLGFDVSKQDFAARSMADFSVAAAQRLNGQGQISDGERKLISTTVAQYKNSPQGNIIGMQWMKALAQREIDRAAYYRDVQDKNGRIKGSEDLEFNRSHPIQAYFSLAASPSNDIFSQADAIISGKK